MRRALENYVEDPLAEELLKGEFQGKNKIVVDGIRGDNGKIKRLEFRGEWVEPEPEASQDDETVGVGAGEGEGEDSNSDD